MDHMNIIEELKTDNEFLAKLGNAKNEAEAKALFSEKGIEVTCDELKAIRNGEVVTEFDETALENVTGGGIFGIAAGIALICLLAGFIRGNKCK